MIRAFRFFVVSFLAIPTALLACSSAHDVDPTTARAQAEALAGKDSACTTDTDCCVVIDNCMSHTLTVSATDRGETVSLLASASAPRDGCFGCIPPAVQVACELGRCAARPVLDSFGHKLADPSFLQNHCGALPLPPGARLTTHEPHLETVAPQGIWKCGGI